MSKFFRHSKKKAKENQSSEVNCSISIKSRGGKSSTFFFSFVCERKITFHCQNQYHEYFYELTCVFHFRFHFIERRHSFEMTLNECHLYIVFSSPLHVSILYLYDTVILVCVCVSMFIWLTVCLYIFFKFSKGQIDKKQQNIAYILFPQQLNLCQVKYFFMRERDEKWKRVNEVNNPSSSLSLIFLLYFFFHSIIINNKNVDKYINACKDIRMKKNAVLLNKLNSKWT